ncbi:hypothetical protein KY332_00795 [Candidatus Woesearchaeota archaeon]|nr:hypothetical protein [Candidatus Woesearchaeota archaeon]
MDRNAKRILVFIALIVGAFALSFLARFFYSPSALTIDELHRRNLEGEESDVNYVYNGYSFIYFDNLWYTQVARDGDTILDIPLHFAPRELEDISIIGEINWQLEEPEVYLTFDPDEKSYTYVTLSIAELSLNLAKGMEIKPIAACSKNLTSACENRPIVTCENKDKAVIYMKQGEGEGEVNLKENCVEIIGKDWELVKATDRFLLQWYNVME